MGCSQLVEINKLLNCFSCSLQHLVNQTSTNQFLLYSSMLVEKFFLQLKGKLKRIEVFLFFIYFLWEIVPQPPQEYRNYK